MRFCTPTLQSLGLLGPLALLAGASPPAAMAQTASAATGWAACAALSQDAAARLACFDQWAARQADAPGTAPVTAPGTAQALAKGATPSTANASTAAMATMAPREAPSATTEALASRQATAAADTTQANPAMASSGEQARQPSGSLRPCADPRSTGLSRFWELEPASDCGTLGIRGYHPLNISWATADGVNRAPSSPAAGHTVTTPVAYQRTEMRLALSVRTKIAKNLLTTYDTPGRDSLWFGYSQESSWQLFNGAISRPFRTTDHQPELTYIYPADAELPGGWRLRYAGLSAVHHSNGQSLPLSRSWNRVVAMAGIEKGNDFSVVARAWTRVSEKSATDDNPDIADYYGRAEVSGYWNVNQDNTLGLTLRHNLRKTSGGSARLEWLYALGDKPSSLRLHTQLFTGYGDTLVDYNRKRTVVSIGLSLVDF